MSPAEPHPPVEALRQSLHEQSATTAQVEAHLQSCGECRARREALADTANTVASTASGGAAFLPRGTALGTYVLLEPLGAGGMGAVYAAWDARLDRKIAIKVLLSGGTGSAADLAERLVREAKAMARLSHPNVLAVHELGEQDGTRFIAMELVEGGALVDWLSAQKRGWREVLGVFRQAGLGLAAAHAAGLVHRDFKPANVLISADGRVRVMDFGLVRLREEPAGAAPAAEGPSRSEALTQAGAFLGTPRYMAPEQFVDANATDRSDQFSFCVALYEALYGRLPFEGDNLVQRTEAMNRDEVVKPPRGEAPRFLFEVLARGLRRDPAQRFPSMQALLEALAKDPARRRRRFLTAAGVGATVALVAGVYFTSERHAARRCELAARSIDEAWSEADRASVRSHFAKVGQVPESTERAIARLDEFSKDWARARSEVCVAERLSAPKETTETRTRCLEIRKRELGALTKILARADERIAGRAIQSALGLTPVGSCADTASLAPGLLTDPKTLELAGRLSELRAEHNAVGGTAALEGTRALAQEAGAANHRALEAEALALEARILSFAGQPRESDAVTRRALRAAIASRHLSAQAQLWTYLAQSLAVDQGKIDEGKEAMAFAEAAAEAMGDSAEARLQVQVLRSIVLWVAQELPAATEAAKKALVLAENDAADERQKLTVLINLGGLLLQTGELEAALPYLERAVAENDRVFGPLHPNGLEGLLNLSLTWSAHVQHPAWREKAEHFGRRAVTVAEGAFGAGNLRTADAVGNLANILAAQDRHEEAAVLAERAAGLYAQGGIEHSFALTTRIVAAQSLSRIGALERAKVQLEAADQIAKKDAHPGTQLLLELAHADHEEAAGQPASALKRLEAVVPKLTGAEDAVLRARTLVRRAALVKKVDPRRLASAVADAEQGRALLTAGGFLADSRILASLQALAEDTLP